MPQLLQPLLLFASVLCAQVHAASPLPLAASTVANIGNGVWIDNIAVRASGEILAVGPTQPILYQVNPNGDTTPKTVFAFSAPVNGLFGLTETTTDMFYVSAGNISHTTLQPVAGSMSVWQVNMNGYAVTGALSIVRQVASFPNAVQLDGMTTVSTSVVLITDTVLGVVWSLNVNTGAVAKILDLADMKPVAGARPALGVNGVHYNPSNGQLYYTSTDQELFVRLAINADGSAAGSPVVVASGFGHLDDFDLDSINNGYVAVNATYISLVETNGKNFVLSGPLAGPTGAKFGRTAADKQTLYVGTNGGSLAYFTGQPHTTPGGILKIAVGAAGYFDYTG